MVWINLTRTTMSWSSFRTTTTTMTQTWFVIIFPRGRVRSIVMNVVCLSVRSHISKTTPPNFTKFSVLADCGRGSVLLWQCCDILPVLWMTLCFHTVGSAARCALSGENNCIDSNRILLNDFGCVSGAQFAVYDCLVNYCNNVRL